MKTARKSLEDSVELPMIISARTGLIPQKDAVVVKLPPSYSSKTIEDALNYLLNRNSLDEDEGSLVKSIKREMESSTYAVVVNGTNAELTDEISSYLQIKEREIDGRMLKYKALDIEVSSVQEGGYY
ncbi:MAG TPA: hypothetical protein VJJ23_03455 [Candidatus Nanoarchaeia archaeon]|nr:hypothetical protein [Candidatus Nanoarchaeia archaeon]